MSKGCVLPGGGPPGAQRKGNETLVAQGVFMCRGRGGVGEVSSLRIAPHEHGSCGPWERKKPGLSVSIKASTPLLSLLLGPDQTHWPE